MVSLQEGQRALRRLVDRLERPDGLEQAWAEAVLRQAQDTAQGKPTPQARMAAESFVVQHGEILSPSGGPPSRVAAGSEFGSSIYRQFGPRNPRGYWLLPAAEAPEPATMAAGEEWLDDAVRAAIRGI